MKPETSNWFGALASWLLSEGAGTDIRSRPVLVSQSATYYRAVCARSRWHPRQRFDSAGDTGDSLSSLQDYYRHPAASHNTVHVGTIVDLEGVK